jgi:hypothetical protein
MQPNPPLETSNRSATREVSCIYYIGNIGQVQSQANLFELLQHLPSRCILVYSIKDKFRQVYAFLFALELQLYTDPYACEEWRLLGCYAVWLF